MSYLTRYSLKVNEEIGKHLEAIAQKAGYENALWEGESVKWYNYVEDLREYSEHYPNTLFILSGIGDEYDDIWRGYFQGGKHYIELARIEFNEFDPESLS